MPDDSARIDQLEKALAVHVGMIDHLRGRMERAELALGLILKAAGVKGGGYQGKDPRGGRGPAPT